MTTKQLTTGLHALRIHYGAAVEIGTLPQGVLNAEILRAERERAELVGGGETQVTAKASARVATITRPDATVPPSATSGAAGTSSTSAEGGSSAAIVGPPPHTAAGEQRRFLFGLRMLVIRMRVGADEA